MKKMTLICAAIAALGAGTAFAGTATSTANKIAVENFGGSAASQDTLAVLGSSISYNMSTATAINNAATVYFTIRLTGGKFAAAPNVTQFSFGGQTCSAGAATTANPLCAINISTDRSTIRATVTTGASYTLGLGAFAWTPAAADINAANTALGTVGGKVTASIGFLATQPTAYEATDTQATIDAPLGTGDLAVAAKGIATSTVAASAYAGKIDLTLSPAASNYTTTGYAVLGSYKFTNAAAGTAFQRGSSTADYTLANGSGNNANTGASVVITPGAGQSFPVGSVLSLHTNVTCSAAVANTTTATITSANASTAKTVSTTTAVASNTDYFVCMTNPSTGNTATPIQATIAATVIPASTNDSIAAASGTGYNLQFNGSSVDVTSYWPGGLAPLGYNGYVRVTNTGSVAAAVSAQHISPTTGAVSGNSAVIVASLAAGQSVVLSTATIDAAVGAAPSGLTVGRLRITAPTNALRVQSLLQVGSNSPIEYSQAGQ